MDRCMQQLRTIYSKVVKQLGLWEDLQGNFIPVIESLTNLADQLRATQMCDRKGLWQKTRLHQFDDLIIRLNYKQVQAMESLMKSIKQDLKAYYDITKTLEKLKSSAFALYKKQAESISLHEAVQPSQMRPALVDLLDWLEEIERSYVNWYVIKQEALNELNYEDSDSVKNLKRLWIDNSCIQHLKHTREQISVFISDAL